MIENIFYSITFIADSITVSLSLRYLHRHENINMKKMKRLRYNRSGEVKFIV